MSLSYRISLVLLLGVSPANAHCYSTWKYPWPQHCGGVYARTKTAYRGSAMVPVPSPRPVSVTASDQDIILPNLNNVTWGGAMDTELELEMQRQAALRKLESE
jgi:hypothetical protein